MSPPPVGEAPDAGRGTKISAASASRSVEPDASAKRDAAPTNAPQDQPAQDEDAGAAIDVPDASVGLPIDAGPVGMDPTTGEAAPTAPDTSATTTTPTVKPECTRDALRSKADAYFEAMASGEPKSLRLHASVRYTENGQDSVLGAGVWARRARTDFSRHVLDETNCSSVSEAVVSALTARIIVAVRLLYKDGQLLDVEAQTVPEDATSTNIAAIIPTGSDLWLEAVPDATRMSRENLERFAEEYFNTATSGGSVPPSAAECRRRQNGVPMEDQGSCRIAPGSMRFEQRRFPVVDEINGIITAAVLYNNHVGFYLFKMAGDKLLNIEVLGGATAASSGW